MSAKPIQYPTTFTPIEFTCKCGTKVRIDFEPISGPEPFYKHCVEDEGKHIAGRLIAVWEERKVYVIYHNAVASPVHFRINFDFNLKNAAIWNTLEQAEQSRRAFNECSDIQSEDGMYLYRNFRVEQQDVGRFAVICDSICMGKRSCRAC